jgi:ribulose 1,5-bisphosphate carboxylase large subunit-like protein
MAIPALVEIFGDDACLQFGGGTLGHLGVTAQVLQQTALEHVLKLVTKVVI